MQAIKPEDAIGPHVFAFQQRRSQPVIRAAAKVDLIEIDRIDNLRPRDADQPGLAVRNQRQALGQAARKDCILRSGIDQEPERALLHHLHRHCHPAPLILADRDDVGLGRQRLPILTGEGQ